MHPLRDAPSALVHSIFTPWRFAPFRGKQQRLKKLSRSPRTLQTYVQVGSRQVRPLQVGAAQVGVHQVAAAQVGHLEVDVAEVQARQVGAAEVEALKSRGGEKGGKFLHANMEEEEKV